MRSIIILSIFCSCASTSPAHQLPKEPSLYIYHQLILLNNVSPSTIVQVRAYVNSEGHALKAEPINNNKISKEVMEAALPCAMNEVYVPAKDKNGKKITAWTRPFEIRIVWGL